MSKRNTNNISDFFIKSKKQKSFINTISEDESGHSEPKYSSLIVSNPITRYLILPINNILNI